MWFLWDTRGCNRRTRVAKTGKISLENLQGLDAELENKGSND